MQGDFADAQNPSIEASLNALSRGQEIVLDITPIKVGKFKLEGLDDDSGRAIVPIQNATAYAQIRGELFKKGHGNLARVGVRYGNRDMRLYDFDYCAAPQRLRDLYNGLLRRRIDFETVIEGERKKTEFRIAPPVAIIFYPTSKTVSEAVPQDIRKLDGYGGEVEVHHKVKSILMLRAILQEQDAYQMRRELVKQQGHIVIVQPTINATRQIDLYAQFQKARTGKHWFDLGMKISDAAQFTLNANPDMPAVPDPSLQRESGPKSRFSALSQAVAEQMQFLL